MADWLIIRLEDGGLAPAFMVVDPAGRQVEAPRAAPLGEAHALSAGRRICALVPGGDVLLTEAEIPARTTGARLQQILPFALEDQLAQDVDDLHFAAGRRDAGAARTPTAVVSRALVEGWLAQLRAAGLEPEALFADSNLLPANPAQAVVVLDQDSILLRAAGGQGMTLPLAALPEALELVQPTRAGTEADAQALPDLGLAGISLAVYATAVQWEQHQAAFEAVRGRFERLSVQLLQDDPLPLLAQGVSLPAAINLLQGPYAPATSHGGWQAWRTAAALLAGLLVLHAVGGAAQLTMLRKTEHRLDTAISEVFHTAMPAGDASPASARRVMESRLHTAQGADESAGLLAMLAAVSQARTSTPGTSVQAMSYRDGQLEMQVNGPGADALDHISQQLRASGWQADLTSTSAVGSAFQGRILVKPHG